MTETLLQGDTTPILPRLLSSHEQLPRVSDRTPKARYMLPLLIVVALERFTYYSIVVNLFLFFKDDVYGENDNSRTGHTSSVVSVMVLIGLSWMSCVFGGWISDAKLGKLETIFWGLVVYAIGSGLLLLSANCIDNYLENKPALYRALIVFASILVALIGEGAFKANIAAFGAEQLDQKDVATTRRFFNLYYFGINIGALLAFGISAYIQQWKGFSVGFTLPFASICLAFLVFVLSRRRYKTLPCQKIAGKVYQIIKEARRNYKRDRNIGISNLPMAVEEKMRWLDHARMKHGGSFLDWEVDEVRYLFLVIPVFILLLPYQAIYSQMSATFLQQGIRMKIYFHDFPHFPVAWLTLFNALVVVILLPVMEKFIYPWFAKRGYSMAPLTRINIGILVACFGIIAAGFVEIFVAQDLMRNNTITNHHVNGHDITAANLPVFFQLPQYVLIGVAEVFANVGGLDFAYRNAPRSMQGLVMAFFFAINSLGSLLGSGLLELSEVVHLITRKKRGRPYYDLTYYFFLLAALMLLTWIVFIIYVEHNRRKRSKLPKTRVFNGKRVRNSPDLSSDVRDGYFDS